MPIGKLVGTDIDANHDGQLQVGELKRFGKVYRTDKSFAQIKDQFKLFEKGQDTQGLVHWMFGQLKRSWLLKGKTPKHDMLRRVAALKGRRSRLELRDYKEFFSQSPVDTLNRVAILRAHATQDFDRLANLLQRFNANHFTSRAASSLLDVNTTDDHYMIEKSEAEGIKDLQALAIKSEKTKVDEVEEAWIYVKGKDGKNHIREFWFEVGEKETTASATISTEEEEKVAKLLKAKGVKVEKWKVYHYHPIDYKEAGIISVGSLFPSSSDLASIVSFYNRWRDLKLGGSFEDAVVTKHGVWRSEWLGPKFDSDSSKVSEYKKRLYDLAWQSRRDLSFWSKYCLAENGLCRDFYKKFGHQLSTPWTRVRFHPINKRKIPKGKIFPGMGPLRRVVRGSNPANYFQKLNDQLAKENKKSKGQKLAIQWDDDETLASVVTEPNGERKVMFNFVIDTNQDPKAGRIYMVDTFWFDKSGKFTGYYNRSFTHRDHLPNAKALSKMSTRYAQEVGKPTYDQLQVLAKEVAQRFLKL